MQIMGVKVYRDGSLTFEVFKMYWHLTGCPHIAAELVLDIYHQVMCCGAPVHTQN